MRTKLLCVMKIPASSTSNRLWCTMISCKDVYCLHDNLGHIYLTFSDGQVKGAEDVMCGKLDLLWMDLEDGHERWCRREKSVSPR